MMPVLESLLRQARIFITDIYRGCPQAIRRHPERSEETAFSLTGTRAAWRACPQRRAVTARFPLVTALCSPVTSHDRRHHSTHAAVPVD
jgi:hypothetical protein